MYERLVEKTREYLSQTEGIKNLSNQCFRLSGFSGQGATSKHYILEVLSSSPEINRKYFVKRYGNDSENSKFWSAQLERDYSISVAISAELSQSSYFCVIKPVFMVPEEQLFVAPYVEGATLSSFFYTNLRFTKFKAVSSYESLCKINRNVGSGLALMQSIKIDNFRHILPLPEKEKIQERYIDNLYMMAHDLREKRINEKIIEECIEYFKLSLKSYFDKEHTLCIEHFDFIPQNFLFTTEDEIFLYDFPNANIGVPFMDVAHFISSLYDLTYLKTVSRKTVDLLVSKFLINYIEKVNIDIDFNVLSAFMIYIQFYSTNIILSKNNNKYNMKKLLITEPKKKFEENIQTYMNTNSKENYFLGRGLC